MDQETINQKLVPCCMLEISVDEQEKLMQMFKALGNSTRFNILKFIATHPYCITGNIVDYVSLAQSTVSQHSKVLRESGWIVGEVEGPSREYCLHEGNIAWFRKKVGEIF